MLGLAVVGAAAAVIVWTAVAARAITRYASWSRFDTLLVLLAVAGTVEAASAVGPLVWPATMGHVLLAAWSVVTLLVGVQLTAMLSGSQRAPRMPVAAAAGAGVTLVALAVVGGPEGRTPDLDWPSRPAMVVFWVGLGALHAVACGYMLHGVVVVQRRLPGGPVRQATQLVAAGLVFAVGFGVALLLLVAETLWWGLRSIGQLGYQYSSISYLLIAAAGLRLGFARWVQHRADVRQIEAITPLWCRLRPVHPSLALLPVPLDPRMLGHDELRVACVRAGIEIRDWMALLAARLPASAWPAAKTAAAEIRDARWDAAATAGWIQAGLDREEVLDLSGTPRAAPPVGADVDEDLALLEAVALVPEGIAAAVAAAIPLPDGQLPRIQSR